MLDVFKRRLRSSAEWWQGSNTVEKLSLICSLWHFQLFKTCLHFLFVILITRATCPIPFTSPLWISETQIKDIKIQIYELFLGPSWLKITTESASEAVVIFNATQDLRLRSCCAAFRILKINKIYILIFYQNVKFEAIQRL